MRDVIKTVALGLLVTVIVFGAACAGPTATPTVVPKTPTPTVAVATPTPAPTTVAVATPTPGPLKEVIIGGNCILSGAGAAYGIAARQAMLVMVDDIAAKGGLKIGNDRYIWKPILYDNKYDTATAVANTQRLVFTDGAKIVWHMGTASWPPSQAITEKAGVLGWAGITGGKELTNPSFPLTFRVGLQASDFAPPVYRQVLPKTYPQVKTVLFVGTDDETGKTMVAQSRQVATASGYTTKAAEFYVRGMTDFTPLATRIVSANPDLVNTTGIPAGDVALIVKSLNQMGFAGKMLDTSGADLSVIVKTAGTNAVEGLLMSGPPPIPVTDGQKALRARSQAKFGPEEPLSQLYETYVHFEVLVQAMEMAGSVDPLKIAATLRSTADTGTTFSTTYGPTFVGGKLLYGIQSSLYHPVPVMIVKNGQPQLVMLAEIARADVG